MRHKLTYTILPAAGAGWRLAKILIVLVMSAVCCSAVEYTIVCAGVGTLYIVTDSGYTQINNGCTGGPWRLRVSAAATANPVPVPKVIPQFVDGAGWETTLVFTNTTASTATASVSFYQETAVGDGSTQAWNPTFLEGSSTQNLSLAGGATLFLHTPGTSSTLAEGWGQATVSDGVEVYAVFSTKGGGQGTSPAVINANHILLPFDNTPGNVTAIAVANPTAVSETVFASFQSEGGAISQSSITIPPQGHKALLLPAQFAATAGNHGLAEFYTANGGISLIGLQSGAGNFFTTAQTYPQSAATIIGAPDPEACWINPFSPPCPQPAILATSFAATIASIPVQIVITPGTNAGTYNAEVSGTGNGATVSGSFVGGTATASAGQSTFTFTSVSPGSTFGSGSLKFTLAETSFDAAAGVAVGNATGSLTLNNLGTTAISGPYTAVVSVQSSVPAPVLTLSLQSRPTGSANLSMAVTNSGGATATNVTVTAITAITATGATLVYNPGLLAIPFVIPGAASLAPGATSGFNLNFTATSGSAGAPFSFVITVKADNVAPFTTTINVN